MTADDIRVRVGGTGDTVRVLALYDQAVTWPTGLPGAQVPGAHPPRSHSGLIVPVAA